MKKLFTIVIAFAFASTSFAQINNNSFENWQTKTGIGLTGPYTYNIPQNWQLGFISELMGSFGIPPQISKSTTANTGNFSLQLSSSADTIGADVQAAFALSPNLMPQAFTGFYKTSGPVTDPNDYGTALVFMTKWNGTRTDTIGYGYADLETAHNGFKQFTAQITYSGTATPDSARVYFLYFPEEGNTHILIDDLAFVSLLGNKENTTFPELTFFPNPVSENQEATLKFNAPKAENATLVIRDMVGKEVKTLQMNKLQAGANTFPVNTHDLKAGIYLATLQSASGSQTFRFVKR